MKKLYKFSGAVLLTALLVILSVLPAFAEITADQEATLRTYAESVMAEMVSYDDATLEEAVTTYESYGMTGISEGFRQWQEVGKDAGEYTGLSSFEVTEAEDGGQIIQATATYTNKSVSCCFVIGSDGYISSISFSEPAESDSSSFGTKMKEASVNLIVGMGTVFAVLIFLCWVISLFKYVGVLEAKLRINKAKEKAVEVKEKADEAREVIPLDNNELQAVIAAAIAAYEADTGCGIEKQPALENGITIKTYRRN